MRISSTIRGAFIALVAVVTASSAALADSGSIRLSILKGGWFIGGAGGNGTLTFQGRTYRLGVGGISGGLVFGGAQIELRGRATNIWRASDVAGVYGAVGAGGAIGLGAGAIRLRNEKGAILELSGRQVGLMINLDLSGMAITIR